MKKYSSIAVLFSGGKDSSLLLNLVNEVSTKLNVDFKIVHIDTGENFSEIITYRDKVVKEMGREFIVEKVIEDKKIGLNRSQSKALKRLISRENFDIVFCGARRDEDKARSKELFFSLRENDSGWEPEKANFEIWPWVELNKANNQHFRVYPLSNWTEEDVWQYISYKDIEVCPLYFSHQREVKSSGKHSKNNVRFRTIGDRTNSIPILSSASSISDVIVENKELKQRERHHRIDDDFSEFSMEIRKQEGYF